MQLIANELDGATITYVIKTLRSTRSCSSIADTTSAQIPTHRRDSVLTSFDCSWLEDTNTDENNFAHVSGHGQAENRKVDSCVMPHPLPVQHKHIRDAQTAKNSANKHTAGKRDFMASSIDKRQCRHQELIEPAIPHTNKWDPSAADIHNQRCARTGNEDIHSEVEFPWPVFNGACTSCGPLQQTQGGEEQKEDNKS